MRCESVAQYWRMLKAAWAESWIQSLTLALLGRWDSKHGNWDKKGKVCKTAAYYTANPPVRIVLPKKSTAKCCFKLWADPKLYHSVLWLTQRTFPRNRPAALANEWGDMWFWLAWSTSNSLAPGQAASTIWNSAAGIQWRRTI